MKKLFDRHQVSFSSEKRHLSIHTPRQREPRQARVSKVPSALKTATPRTHFHQRQNRVKGAQPHQQKVHRRFGRGNIERPFYDPHLL
ncbi:hypothetical protein [Secundilactobacillus folii]|uniref:Uncharacterized protein n=1 Tax=Secundilactobacillus folii TaxID=2678357 RepID=A0A7X2XVH3_9LACO|nr:hypothetical protein [Secundilactobacillus folii]MTV82295.1 hypothetical protein [Secundilactobacillus folii]